MAGKPNRHCHLDYVKAPGILDAHGHFVLKKNHQAVRYAEYMKDDTLKCDGSNSTVSSKVSAASTPVYHYIILLSVFVSLLR